MQELCRNLKDKRKELGYSIEYVVEKTKLHPSVIKDIEACDFSNIGQTYLRGFIRIYAKFLEVDLGDALADLSFLSQQSNSTKITRRSQGPSIFTVIINKIKNINPQTKKKIVFVLLCILVVWSFIFVSKLAVRKISAIFKKRPLVEKKVEPQVPKKVVNENQDLVVSLTAKKKCFLRVVVDNKLLFEGVLNQGAIESWTGTKEIEFKISDGSAIYLEVNGKPIPTLSSIRKPIKSLKITPLGITVDK